MGIYDLEVIITIIIISILVTFAIPRYTNTSEKSRVGDGVQILTVLLGAQKSYQFENNVYSAGDCTALDVSIPPATATSNFADPICASNAAKAIVTIQRTGGLYTLGIKTDGSICCNDGTQTLCAKIGYPTTCPP